MFNTLFIGVECCESYETTVPVPDVGPYCK